MARLLTDLCTPAEKERIVAALWQNGKLNRRLIARDADVLARDRYLAYTDSR